MPKPEDRLICRIVATDGTGHRPFTTLDLASLQALLDPEEVFYQAETDCGMEWRCHTPFNLIDGSDVTKREWIGNMVPGAATGMAETIGETFMLADMGETFFLSTREIWVRPGAIALAMNNDQVAFRKGRSMNGLGQLSTPAARPHRAGEPCEQALRVAADVFDLFGN